VAKSGNQKLKLLYIAKILEEESDEQHCISMQELIKKLEEYDVSAERKSIYDDMEQLMKFGYDIVYVKARAGGGYYLAGRRFELPELKLLVDAVQSSRFITLKKSRELIHKIEQLAGKYEAKQLQRQVYVAGRIKYYRVDKMGTIRVIDGMVRAGRDSFRQFDIGAYTNKTFGMFGGEEAVVTLELPERMLGIVLDRFGKETDIRRKEGEDGIFLARIEVAVSSQFFGWLTGLGESVRIASPENVAERYRDYLKGILERYNRL
jgi:hypothetical protein